MSEEPTQEDIQQRLDALLQADIDFDITKDEQSDVPPYQPAAARDAYAKLLEVEQRYIAAFDWLVQYGTVHYNPEHDVYKLQRF